MKIILLGIDHEAQWKDTGGHLREILVDLINKNNVDLVAEEATGLPTTVAQRLACKFDKPWIEIDFSVAERKLVGIYEGLVNRQPFPVLPFDGRSFGCGYLPKEDTIREEEWMRRILRQGAEVVLCLCGHMHVDPFTKKLEKAACDVEKLALTELPWFQDLYGKQNIVERDGRRWCETRRQ